MWDNRDFKIYDSDADVDENITSKFAIFHLVYVIHRTQIIVLRVNLYEQFQSKKIEKEGSHLVSLCTEYLYAVHLYQNLQPYNISLIVVINENIRPLLFPLLIA